MAWMPVTAQNPFKQLMRKTDPAYFKTDEARQVGNQLLLYQRVTGGWPKNIDMARPLTSDEQAQLLIDKEKPDDSTTDNDATNIQMMFLARLYQNTKDLRYREAFRKGVEYLLSGQYENGGWPQFWPEMHGYQIHITYNDDAMVNTLKLFRDMMAQKEPYQGDLTDQALRKRMAEAFDKGIDCILATQIVKDGVPTVWCQQHDRETFEPAPARAFELPSYCSMESVSLTRLLMELPNPDDRVKKAVHAAMRWFDKYKLTGYKIVRVGSRGSYDQDTRLEKDPHAETLAASLYPLYEKWAEKYDPAHKVAISLHTKGANENGTIDWFRKPVVNAADFDAVVNPGDSIQLAIEKAPAQPTDPYKILIRKGTYHQKVIIDRPNIVLVGEERDSTVLVLAETAKTQAITEYHDKPVGNGVIVLQDGADDCVISGLATQRIRWRSSAKPPVLSSSIATCGPMVMMPSRSGHRRNVTVCTTMPTSICDALVSIFSVHVAGVLLCVVISWVTAVPSSGMTDEVTRIGNW